MEKTYMIPGSGQIELFTDHNKKLTLVKFKSGEVCYIANKDIETFKREIYNIIQKYKIEEKTAAPKAL